MAKKLTRESAKLLYVGANPTGAWAEVVKLADTGGLKLPERKLVWVQLPPSAFPRVAQWQSRGLLSPRLQVRVLPRGPGVVMPFFS